MTTITPSISECALTTRAARTVLDSVVLPESTICACNAGWEVPVQIVTGSGIKSWTCDVDDPATTIVVSTEPLSLPTPEAEPEPEPVYAAGTCNLHILEAAIGRTGPVFGELNVTDGEGSLIASQKYEFVSLHDMSFSRAKSHEMRS